MVAVCASPAPTVRSIVDALLNYVDADISNELCAEDPAAAMELYFAPVGCQAMPSSGIVNSQCSIDGFYESQIDVRSWIATSTMLIPTGFASPSFTNLVITCSSPPHLRYSMTSIRWVDRH